MDVRTKSLFFLVITALLWSCSGVVIKSVDWNPLAIASARGLVAGVTIMFLNWNRLGPRFTGGEYLIGLIMVLLSVSFVSATKLTTAANAILLQYTAPVWVALMAPLLLREKTSGRDWFFMALAIGGVALFFRDGLSQGNLWGNILGLLSGVFFAAIALALRSLSAGHPARAVVLGNFMTFLGGLYFWQPPWPDLIEILILIAAGVFQFGLSYHLYSLASRGASSLEMVLVPIIEPILNPVWVFLVIGEPPGFWALIGGLVVLSSITVWSLLKLKSPVGQPIEIEV